MNLSRDEAKKKKKERKSEEKNKRKGNRLSILFALLCNIHPKLTLIICFYFYSSLLIHVDNTTGNTYKATVTSLGLFILIIQQIAKENKKVTKIKGYKPTIFNQCLIMCGEKKVTQFLIKKAKRFDGKKQELTFGVLKKAKISELKTSQSTRIISINLITSSYYLT